MSSDMSLYAGLFCFFFAAVCAFKFFQTKNRVELAFAFIGAAAGVGNMMFYFGIL